MAPGEDPVVVRHLCSDLYEQCVICLAANGQLLDVQTFEILVLPWRSVMCFGVIRWMCRWNLVLESLLIFLLTFWMGQYSFLM